MSFFLGIDLVHDNVERELIRVSEMTSGRQAANLYF